MIEEENNAPLPEKSKRPKPNMNGEYMIDISPTLDGKVQLYDISVFFEPYNSRERDSKIKRVDWEIHGTTASVYIIDAWKLLTRPMAIQLAKRFIDGNFSSIRLD